MREKKFINFTNHKSEAWEQKQIDAAREYGEIMDIPFPNVDPQCSEQEIKEIGEQCCREILWHNPEAVLCQGEFTLTVEIVQRLKSAGVRVLAACSERVVTEREGIKTSVFRFVRFREYN